MEYAKQYRIGHHSKAQKAKAANVISPVERIHSSSTATKGRAGHQQGQAQVGAHIHAADVFLKMRFLPKLKKPKTTPSASEIEQMEADFYGSLCRIANHYGGFEPLDTRLFGYPYNMAFSVWELENHLKKHVENWSSLRLVQDDNGKTFFISEEQYKTGTDLYYIPIIPLYRMLKSKETKRAAQLLLSVCAYLYHVADIPYYQQEDTYMFWQYQRIEEWIEEDEQTEQDCRKDELKVAVWAGDKMEQKLFNRKNLDVFASRVAVFKPCNELEAECLKVAKDALALYMDYPAATVFRHAVYSPDMLEPEDGIITMNTYISFIADTKGWLFEELAECINIEFGECGVTEQPGIQKYFDGNTRDMNSLEFEVRLFRLIDDLCFVLNNY